MYPPGDWLGNVRPSDVPALLKLYTDGRGSDVSKSSLSRLHRRGRMGRSKEAELKLHEDARASNASTEALKPAPRAASTTWSIPFVSYDGSIISVPATEGDSLMKVAKATGVPSIEGVCDGKLEVPTRSLRLFDRG